MIILLRSDRIIKNSYKKCRLQITSSSFIIFIKFIVRGHCSEPFYRVRVNQRDRFPLNVGGFPLSATPPPPLPAGSTHKRIRGGGQKAGHCGNMICSFTPFYHGNFQPIHGNAIILSYKAILLWKLLQNGCKLQF